jgi:hypothetical protein
MRSEHYRPASLVGDGYRGGLLRTGNERGDEKRQSERGDDRDVRGDCGDGAPLCLCLDGELPVFPAQPSQFLLIADAVNHLAEHRGVEDPPL